MSKASRCYLHLACIVKTLARRKKVQWNWHWQHILREFGYGTYCKPSEPSDLENIHALPHRQT